MGSLWVQTGGFLGCHVGVRLVDGLEVADDRNANRIIMLCSRRSPLATMGSTTWPVPGSDHRQEAGTQRKGLCDPATVFPVTALAAAMARQRAERCPSQSIPGATLSTAVGRSRVSSTATKRNDSRANTSQTPNMLACDARLPTRTDRLVARVFLVEPVALRRQAGSIVTVRHLPTPSVGHDMTLERVHHPT